MLCYYAVITCFPQEDDHVSLAPAVELNYEKDAQPFSQEVSVIAPALRQYVANAGVDMDAKEEEAHDRGARGVTRTVELQQERIDERLQGQYGDRFKKNISNWFHADGGAGGDDDRSRAVRFAVDDDPTEVVAAAIASGEAIPGAASGAVGRTQLVIPAPTSFRTATRHPSHLPLVDDLESRLDAPRRILAARKRHRRNDSFLRLTVAILCFGLSLAFACLYGQGQFGLAVTTLVYERKVRGRYDDVVPVDWSMHLSDIFYPDWWEQERGIPDMESKNIQFSITLEYNAADVLKERAPGRIETPFFWFVPRSGGNVVRTIISKCLRLAEASEYGAGSEAAVRLSLIVQCV